MKKNNSVGIILGLLFLAIGVGYLAEAVGVIPEFTIFFDGWWSLFVIVPCFCGLCGKGGGKIGYLIGIAIGLFLLLSAQGILNGDKLWAILFAVICVLIGVNLILPKKRDENRSQSDAYTDRFDRRQENGTAAGAGAGAGSGAAGSAAGATEHFVDAEVVNDGGTGRVQEVSTEHDSEFRSESRSYQNAGEMDKLICSAVFAGRDIRVDNSIFNGADLTAMFGGIDLNLKNAVIQRNVTIDVKAVFGGVDILMPSNVRVVVDVSTIFGGVDNGTRTPLGADENTPTVFIKGTCLFGGVEVK